MDWVDDLPPPGELPYLNLIQHFSTNAPERYLMEPVPEEGDTTSNGLRRLRVNDAMEVHVTRYSKDFGSLSRVFEKHYECHGRWKWVFFRRDRGTLDHGLSRTDEDVYECAKYYDTRRLRGSETDSPDCSPDTAVMSAPLLPRCAPLEEDGPDGQPVPRAAGQFSIPKKSQPSALTRVFETPELCLLIMKAIGHRWEDVSNLSRTCQTVLFSLNSISTHVDFNQGNFMNMNVPDDVLEATHKKYGYVQNPGTTEFVVVSGIRDSVGNGGAASPGSKQQKCSYRGVVLNTFPLMETLSVRGQSIKILHLHSIPNIDLSMLKLALRCLPNLEVLGIYNCELLHFGATVPVLDAVITHNRESGRSPIRVDFSPYYYFGVHNEATGEKIGEYGVIPSDLGTIKTRKAVVSILRVAVRMAIANGIDWFTPGTGMRLFLDRLPWAVGSIRYILESLYNLYYLDAGFYGSPTDNSPWMNAMRHTLWNDLVLGVHGRAMARHELDFIMTDGAGNLDLLRCGWCEEELPYYFYTRDWTNAEPAGIQCSGCELGDQLHTHVDNFYQQKKHLVEKFLLSGEISMDALLNDKGIATDEELGNRKFPFWKVSVKSKHEVLEACGGDTSALILDGRPGAQLPDDYKQIWLWKKALVRAMSIAERHIDKGIEAAKKRIAKYQVRLDQLDEVYCSGILEEEWEQLDNRDKAQDLSRKIDKQKARCGLIQMGGSHWWGAKAASDWDTEIRQYRETVKSISRQANGQFRSIWGSYWDDAFPRNF
ncbi:hypothetical protein F4805DRAFT_455739 [Annulohypoxylon moriforme]|nr:hypothetical protein F4805DRAFT_455739 [Annulohypoxylon moriforme]